MFNLTELIINDVDKYLAEKPPTYRAYTSTLDEKRLAESLRGDNDFCVRLVLRENLGVSELDNLNFPTGRVDSLFGFEAIGYLRRAVKQKPERVKILKEFQW